MLKDFTLEMCVPNFRWIAAHLMQRNTPSCAPCQYWSVICRIVVYRNGVASIGRGRGWRCLHSMRPMLRSAVSIDNRSEREGTVAPTWVSCLTVGAEVVSRDRLDQIVQDFFVTRLLALAEDARHSGE